MDDEQEEGLDSPQERFEEAAAAVNASMTATREKIMFKILVEIRRAGDRGAEMRESCVEEIPQEKSQEGQENLMPGCVRFPEVRPFRDPSRKRLRINGRASEDREEWMVELKSHCERCYDDKDETSQMQEDRNQEQL